MIMVNAKSLFHRQHGVLCSIFMIILTKRVKHFTIYKSWLYALYEVLQSPERLCGQILLPYWYCHWGNWGSEQLIGIAYFFHTQDLKAKSAPLFAFLFFFFYPLHHLKIAIYWDKRKDLSHRYISLGKINRGCQFSAFLSLFYSLMLIWPTQSSWQKWHVLPEKCELWNGNLACFYFCVFGR